VLIVGACVYVLVAVVVEVIDAEQELSRDAAITMTARITIANFFIEVLLVLSGGVLCLYIRKGRKSITRTFIFSPSRW
jgi:hypothetical protein